MAGRSVQSGAVRSARSVAAETRFRARLAELGAVLLEPAWLGREIPHRVRCAAGHDCIPRPKNVMAGQGVCSLCRPGGLSLDAPVSLDAEARFRARLAELGAVLLEPAWLGVNAPHRVRCAAGHDCTPHPNHTLAGAGICRRRGCVGSVAYLATHHTAEARFRARLAELGAVLLEPYRNVRTPHRVRCAAGHVSATWPTYALSGGGICIACAGRWDVFYVVADAGRYRIKVGITSGDPRPRLRVHRTAGYRDVVRLMTGLPGTVAPEIESAVLAALALAGVRPVWGREHYDAGALAVVLDVADNYPIPPVLGLTVASVA